MKWSLFQTSFVEKKVHVDKIQKYFESWFMHKWSMSAWEETWEEKMLCMCKCIVHKTCSMDHMSVHRMRQIAVWVFVYKSWMFPFFFYRFHFLIPKHITYIYSLCSQYSDSLLIVVQTAGGLERNHLYCCHNKTIPTIKQLLSILVYFLVKG